MNTAGQLPGEPINHMLIKFLSLMLLIIIITICILYASVLSSAYLLSQMLSVRFKYRSPQGSYFLQLAQK